MRPPESAPDYIVWTSIYDSLRITLLLSSNCFISSYRQFFSWTSRVTGSIPTSMWILLKFWYTVKVDKSSSFPHWLGIFIDDMNDLWHPKSSSWQCFVCWLDIHSNICFTNIHNVIRSLACMYNKDTSSCHGGKTKLVYLFICKYSF